MSFEGMYTAIKSAAGLPHSLSRPSCSVDQMVNFVVQASRGLVEVTYDVHGCWGYDGLLFQFIHESVRQHLKGGLIALRPGLTYDSEVRILTIAAEWCQDYIQSFEAVDTDFPVESSSSIVAWDTLAEAPGTDVCKSLSEAFPFLFYAHFWVFYHLNMAYVDEAYDLKDLRTFPLQQWINASNAHLVEGAPYVASTSPLYLFSLGHACQSDPGIIRGMFQYCYASSSPNQTEHEIIPIDKEFSSMLLGRNLKDYCGGLYGTPLVAMACHGSKSYIQLFLDCGADPNAYGGKTDTDTAEFGQPDPYWEPPLSAAAHSDRNLEMAKLLIERGASIDFQGGQRGPGQCRYVEVLLQQLPSTTQIRWLSYYY